MSDLVEFGKFRLDAGKKILWHDGEVINLPLKEIELLCVITATSEIVTKDEILTRVWQDSFVEESNLSSHVYRLRKMFTKYGESEDIIQTIPKRGYRFTGEVVHTSNIPDLIIEKHTFSQTLIEEIEDSVEPNLKQLTAKAQNRWWMPILATLILVSSVFGYYFYNRSKPENIKSIAILPLTSLSSDENEKALALGIKEKLLMNLGSLPEINIQNVSFDESQLDKITNADAILLGNVQKADGKIRVNLRFLRASDKKQIWSESFDENQTDLFKLQDAISAKITNSLALNLTKPNRERIFKRYTENRDAYEAYLRGRYFFLNREKYLGLLDKAEKEFNSALSFDDKFALAYSGLADVYSRKAINLNGIKRGESYDKAKSLALKALALDDNLAETHASIGWIYRIYDWNWLESEKHFKRAIELGPNDAENYRLYSTLLIVLGRTKEAVEFARKAYQLDPLSQSATVGWALINDRQYEAAIEEYSKQIDKSLGTFDDFHGLSIAYLQAKKFPEAIETVQKMTLETKNRFASRAVLTIAYHNLGEKEKSAEILTALEKQSALNDGNYVRLAIIYAEIGKIDQALLALEKGFEKHDDRIVWLKSNPQYDSIRQVSRFQEILRKMNLQ